MENKFINLVKRILLIAIQIFIVILILMMIREENWIRPLLEIHQAMTT